MATNIYPVLSPIMHDGDEYVVGSKVEMDTKFGDALVAAGALGAGKTAKAAKADQSDQSDPAS